MGVNIDITRRKWADAALSERNAQLDLAGKIAGVGSFAVDFSTNIIHLSPGCAALFGLPENATTMSREEARMHVHPDDLVRLDTVRNNALRNRESELVAQYRVIRPDSGATRWVEARSLTSYSNHGRPLRMVGVAIDFTAHKQAEDHKSLLLAELDHRVKNTLASVSAMAEQTRVSSSSIDEFLDMLRGRIRSLANTHALLSHTRWHGVELTELVRSELAPCLRDNNVIIEGPAIVLTSEAVQAVAIVLHELATNAAKYGALSSRHGQVSVCWRRQPNGASGAGVVLEWREIGGPPVKVSGALGYGTSVIRELIPYELGGTVDYLLAPAGVACLLEIPAKWLRDETMGQQGYEWAWRQNHFAPLTSIDGRVSTLGTSSGIGG